MDSIRRALIAALEDDDKITLPINRSMHRPLQGGEEIILRRDQITCTRNLIVKHKEIKFIPFASRGRRSFTTEPR
jgi:hypothetical protein